MIERTPQNSVLVLRDDGTMKTLEEIEREVITFALIYASGGMSKAARVLKIGRSTLYRKVGSDDRKI